MPVSFSRLRISGFKSFAEPAIVDILPGLTGIVGPNGCGKSNVVEALRWAMGESSARSLRGGEMDDVIFAGTAARASRNIAEVTLLLDGAHGIAPPPFHEQPELEIVRRIERGNGSAYRINGREARARDVQTLFNDLATGAHSSGLVSQGRVGALVNAKPDERRRLLEEAAGITGLHARRHEAELKLRAAEANLGRAEDLRGQLESQLESLKRQARQANRYRAISGLVRAAEAELLSLQRSRAERLRAAAHAARHESAAAVAEATTAAAAAAAAAAEAAAALPPLRSTESEARTILERARIGTEQLAAEATRIREALAAAATRLAQTGQDRAHAADRAREADAALARLADETARLDAEDGAHPARFQAAETAAIEAAEAARALDAEANRLTEHAADLAARHRALADALAQADQRLRRVTGQAEQVAAEQARLAAARVSPERLAEARTAQTLAAEALAAATTALESAERDRTARLAAATTARAAALESAAATKREALAAAATARIAALTCAESLRAAAQEGLATARTADTAAAGARSRLATEAQALAEVLAVADNERWPRMVDQLTVPAGLEAALGAVLGEELDSAADTEAARHWRALPPLPAPALPGGTPLSTLVEAPAALARALAHIALVDDDATGAALQPALAPGQTLVSRAGAVWRWDGYAIKSGTPTAAAVRLQQRNRLADLRARLADATALATAAAHSLAQADAAARAARTEADTIERQARAEADSAERTAAQLADSAERTARTAADAEETAARTAEQTARSARRTAEQHAESTRAAAQALVTADAQAESRLAGLAEQSARLAADLADATAAHTAARDALSALPDPAAARAAMERARTSLTEARAREQSAVSARDALARAAAGRANRRRLATAEAQDWTHRAADAAQRLTDLTARAAEAAAEHATLSSAPAEIATRQATALDALDSVESAHRRAADALLQAESTAQSADRTARAAESTLATARERDVRAEGEATQADHAWGVVAERVLERLGATPDLPEPPADITPESEDKARRKLERLQREREEMGPVNLRADVEADDIADQIAAITREREELTTAIAKLRGSIGHLNREGRERLAAVFAQVDQHFQTLFTRMFGGGRAHLALVGSDDPLEAGLEIYAQPPGKKLAALSLLSGGEQALTALSLIFAVFRCNPAPVCVLDEVDAPLDDANVERFCTLLEDMVRETGTRFLVVTHHQHTMARMDRLYGVTMQERGVSRLLSVDLTRASEMVEAPLLAAE